MGILAACAVLLALVAGSLAERPIIIDRQRCVEPYKACSPSEDPPKLASERTWASAKPAAARSITIVTQLSIDRLPRLREQCAVWRGGDISAAVWVPVVGDRTVDPTQLLAGGPRLPKVAARLAGFHAAADASDGCALSLEMVVQRFSNASEAAVYPVNALRNRALARADTEAVLLLDVDFLPSPALLEEYRSASGRSRLRRLLRGRRAVVLPAFQPMAGHGAPAAETTGLAQEVALGGKPALLQAWRQRPRLVRGFQDKEFAQGHRPTDLARWATATEPYGVEYQLAYEPYVLVARRYVPWACETFAAYGFNKISHILQLWRQIREFVVHPSAFVIHVPHEDSAARKYLLQESHLSKVQQRMQQVHEEIMGRTFKPTTAFAGTRLATVEPCCSCPDAAAESQRSTCAHSLL